MNKNSNVEFGRRYKVDDAIYFWLPSYGGCNASKVVEYSKSQEAYLTKSSLYVRETDLIFNNLEELYDYGKEHMDEIVKDNGCGYSFGCDFLD